MGADAVFAPESPDIAKIPQTLGRPLDAVIDAVGRPEILNAGLPLIRMGGAIGVYGVLSEATISLEKERGPYNFNLYMHQWPTRRRERDAQDPLCEWIRQDRIRAADFITHEFALEDIAEALERVTCGEVIKALLRY
jgi:threonine dehydrogenase-like Zn-dependent dehydrogenase